MMTGRREITVDRTFLLIGAVAGFLGVALGAFGAHGLRSRVSPEMLAVFETAVRYQMYHALALVATSVVSGQLESTRFLKAAGWLFAVGMALFSGSLYVVVLGGATAFGAITPIGGLAFLLGWACLALAAL